VAEEPVRAPEEIPDFVAAPEIEAEPEAAEPERVEGDVEMPAEEPSVSNAPPPPNPRRRKMKRRLPNLGVAAD
jgi:hypothetical protein